MGKRDHRPSANELRAKHGLVFGGPPQTFAEAFPTIATLRVEVTESGHGVHDYSALGMAKGQSVITKEYFRPYIDCSNSLCRGGGFYVERFLGDMVRDGKTEAETSGFCQGNEASPGGRRIYRKCLNHFKVKVAITYKSATEQ